jgi:hypothetical protein
MDLVALVAVCACMPVATQLVTVATLGWLVVPALLTLQEGVFVWAVVLVVHQVDVQVCALLMGAAPVRVVRSLWLLERVMAAIVAAFSSVVVLLLAGPVVTSAYRSAVAQLERLDVSRSVQDVRRCPTQGVL